MYTHASSILPGVNPFHVATDLVPKPDSLKLRRKGGLGSKQLSITSRRRLSESTRKFKNMIASVRDKDNHKKCENCQNSEAKICLKSVCGIDLNLVSF